MRAAVRCQVVQERGRFREHFLRKRCVRACTALSSRCGFRAQRSTFTFKTSLRCFHVLDVARKAGLQASELGNISPIKLSHAVDLLALPEFYSGSS